MIRRSALRPTGGSAMMVALIGITVLLFLSVTLLGIGRAMTGHALRQTRETQALAAAEAACSRGLVMLEQGAIVNVPYSSGDLALGGRTMDVDVVGIYSGTSGAYSTDSYEVRGTGRAANIQRTVALGAKHDSFLRYSRFVESGALSYSRGATIAGQVHAGGNVSLTGYPVTFMDDLTVTGRIVNKSYGVFQGAVTEGASPIALSGSMDVAKYRALSQSAGLYYGSGTPSMDLSLFDFSSSPMKYDNVNLPSTFNGIIFAERDIEVRGVLEGRSLTVVAGDDLIIGDNITTGYTNDFVAEQKTKLTLNRNKDVKGTVTVDLAALMGTTVCQTVRFNVKGPKWSRLNLTVYEGSSVLGITTLERPTGATSTGVYSTSLAGLTMDPSASGYTAVIDYWTTGSGSNQGWIQVAGGDPVNIGLIAKDYVYISKYAPRILTVDAALFARDSNWRPVDYTDSRDSDGSHRKCYGAYDLDQDGEIEAMNEDGWDERNCDANTWMLNINGPIITRNGGSAGAWSYYGDRYGKGTRHYNYDDDIVHFQPPEFPVILSRWAVTYWREV